MLTRILRQTPLKPGTVPFEDILPFIEPAMGISYSCYGSPCYSTVYLVVHSYSFLILVLRLWNPRVEAERSRSY